MPPIKLKRLKPKRGKIRRKGKARRKRKLRRKRKNKKRTKKVKTEAELHSDEETELEFESEEESSTEEEEEKEVEEEEDENELLQQRLLYVPKDVRHLRVDLASRDKELCAHLEDILVHWIGQAKEVLLSSQNVLDMDRGPLDELAFWELREDLTGLIEQVNDEGVRTVRETMQIIKSPFVGQFNAITSEILDALNESISNAHYLSILREPCEKLHAAPINETAEELRHILWLIRIIWLNSPFYNTRDKLNGLVHKVSTELIIKCTSEIDVERVFDGFVNSSEAALQRAIKCLHDWREKYIEAQKMHSMFSNTPWLLEYDIIFAHVDAFTQRTRDLLEICVCQKLFARRFEGNQEALPLYPGVKAPGITRIMEEAEQKFCTQLHKLREYAQVVLDVKNAEWHEQMDEFRALVKKLEIMVQNALFNAFEFVNNIEQGVQLLKTFYNFYQREIIIRAYDKLTVKLYKMFEEETNLVKSLYSKMLPLPLSGFPQVAGRAAWALYMKQRLDLHYQCLADAWFLPECGYGNEAIAQYKALAQALVEFADRMYTEWLAQLGTTDLAERLKIPLMIRSTSMPGMIEVNMDKILHKNIVEGEIWLGLGKEIPDVLRSVFQQRDKLHKIRETVLLVVKDYNKIVEALSEEERSLFKGRIKLLDRKLYAGLTKLTWASNVSDEYIHDCRMAANMVQGFTDDYKNANLRIRKLATKISDRPLVRMNHTQAFPEFGFRDFQAAVREKAILKIAKAYKDITLILRQLFEMFETDGQEVMTQWTKYLNVVDKIAQDALCTNVRRSLEILKRGLEDNARSGEQTPVFEIDVIIENNTIAFSPPISEVSDMVLGIYPTICHTIRPFPRIIQFLGDPSARVQSFSHILANDDEARFTQQQISEIVFNCTNRVEKYLKAFEPYRDIWEVDKDWFMKRYEKLLPTITSFDTDIGRYVDVRNIIDAQDNIHNVGFCVLDCAKIKDTISRHCRLWQDRICKLLFLTASRALLGCYKYMSDNLARFARTPDQVEELVRDYHLFRSLAAEVPSKELSFSDIYDQFECLSKYDFDLGEEIAPKIENLGGGWRNYLQKLKEADNTLKKVKLRMRKIFVGRADEFREKVNDLIQDYNTQGPDLSEGLTEDVQEELGDYLLVADELKAEEQELLGSLEIFDIQIPPNINLKNFIKKLSHLQTSLPAPTATATPP